MNKLKSIFVMPFMATDMLIGLFGLYQLIMSGPSLAYLGVVLATLPFGLFVLVVTMISPRARTSNRLPLISALILAGLACSTAGFVIGGFASPAPLGLALFGATGFMLYNYWYSSFDRTDSVQLQLDAPLPNFLLHDINGDNFPSTHLLGKPTVLLFFRGNWCPLCMAQIQEIADGYKALADRGAQVALISPQPHENTIDLASRFDVPFVFLTDPGNEAAKILDISLDDGIPLGISGYDPDTVMPTVIITSANGRIIFLDQTDNYRVRPEPGTFIEALDAATGPSSLAGAS
jgi:peroxiredoxin